MGKLVSFDAPNVDESTRNDVIRVFLGGTIDNGDSEDWQHELIKRLKESEDMLAYDVHVYNPRREDWRDDQGWMNGQVTWELSHQEKADIIVMNILADSKSPISLLELGLNAKDDKMVVFCTDKFYRFNNVAITCDRYNVPLIKSNEVGSIYGYLRYVINKKANNK